ncbi:MAG: arginine--tRNA ligase [Anaerolineaceae bacterium]|jgi:arginyl-tRNA synthetase
MFETEQKQIETRILEFCAENGLPTPVLQWAWIPFSGQWGISTSFFQLASQEAKLGKKVVVPQRAQELAQRAATYVGRPEGFERVEAVKGYLNFYFNSGDYANRVIATVLKQGESFGKGAATGKRVMVEFSQPNTHKAFHVGHLRTMFLGDATCNLLEFAGNEVVRANYIGDIGLHVIKWLWNYMKFHADEQPPVENRTRWMGDLYAEAEKRFEASEENEAEVRALFGRWEQRDPEVVELWQKSRQWSLDGFAQVYDLLGVRFDKFYFESEEEEPGKAMVKELIDRGLARDERPEGAVVIPLDEILGTDEKYRVLVILRSDGTSLYATKDLPLAIRKFEEYHLDRSIYVVDVRQSLYLQQIYKVLELLGYTWAKDCYHLGYELVNLPGNVTMSSREGTVVLLEDLVREATQRALKIVTEKNPDLSAEKQLQIAQAVAIGAIKYVMVARENTKVVTFDWQSALDINGQAAPYVQYAYVRCNGILRKAGGSLPKAAVPAHELSKQEVELVNQISRLPDEVQRAAANFKLLEIAQLSYELARAFNDFYTQCPVLQAEESVRNFRLRLVAAARQAIANSLAILGITAPQAM